MSADNGICIRKNDEGNYEVRYYNASTDYEGTDDMSLLKTFKTLEEAIIYGQEQETEYGLHFVGLGLSNLRSDN